MIRIGLLAPFEGRYREVGYNAYYSAKLAIQESGRLNIELVALDDGGTIEMAVQRARALTDDPLVKVVVALGYAATDASTQQAFGDLPVLIAGHWGTEPSTPSVFVLASSELEAIYSVPPRLDIIDATKVRAPLIGGEVFALDQLSKLRDNLIGITIVSSAHLPEANFRDRYKGTSVFAPEPGIVATSTYLAIDWLLGEIIASRRFNAQTPARSDIQSLLDAHFHNGYWIDAEAHYYRYDENGELIPVNSLIE